jgi:hypothetical protein
MKTKKIIIFILISITLILLKNIAFFKKTYFVLTKNYQQRFIDGYNKDYFSGYCSKEAHGYVYYIKSKYKDDYSPKIINFEKKRRKLPYWIFYKPYNKINENKIILLNYNNSKEFKLDKFIVIDNYNNKCMYLKKKNGNN